MNILEEMYESDLFNFTNTDDMGDDFHETLSRLLKAEQRLVETYPDCKAMFEEYQAAEMDLNHIGHRHEFIKGFIAGAKIIMEILKPNE